MYLDRLTTFPRHRTFTWCPDNKLEAAFFVMSSFDQQFAGRQINVRLAQMADLETLVEFNIAMAHETEGKELDLDLLREGVSSALKRDDRGFYLVAQVGGQVAGQLFITREWSDWRNGFFWWIQSVYVHPDHRRQGIYRALDQRVKNMAVEQGNVCGVRLYVDRNNQAAQQVYRRLGMSQSHYDLYEIEFEPPA